MDGAHYRFAIVTNKEVLEEKKYDGCAVFAYLPVRIVGRDLYLLIYIVVFLAVLGSLYLSPSFSRATCLS